MREIIESAWENRELLKEQATKEAIHEVIGKIDSGELRVAEPLQDGRLAGK